MSNGKKVVVHKFGGTSVRDQPWGTFNIVMKSIQADESPVVVVSALAGVTNLLEEVFRKRHAPDQVGVLFCRIDLAYQDWLQKQGLEMHLLDEELAALRTRFITICNEASSFQQLRDGILAMGEPLSAKGFAAYCEHRYDVEEWLGVQNAIAVDTSGSCDEGSSTSLRTSNRFGSASPLNVEANSELRDHLLGLIEGGSIPIVTGFIGRCGSGKRTSVTTVGRGGSDLTACYLGALLEAIEVRIWSDVPGMLSADPRIVGKEHARPLPSLPFRHAMEMAGGGGKLHPRALVYAAKANVPVRMLSTFEPEAAGTLISNDCQLSLEMVGVVQLKNVTLIHIFDPVMSEVEGFVADVTRVLARHGVVIGLIATGEVEVTMTVTDPSQRLEEAIDEIRSEMGVDPQIVSDLSLVTVVHTWIDAAIEERIARCLKDARVEHVAVSRGASRIALQLAVSAEEADKAVRALHEELLKAD